MPKRLSIWNNRQLSITAELRQMNQIKTSASDTQIAVYLCGPAARAREAAVLNRRLWIWTSLPPAFSYFARHGIHIV